MTFTTRHEGLVWSPIRDGSSQKSATSGAGADNAKTAGGNGHHGRAHKISEIERLFRLYDSICPQTEVARPLTSKGIKKRIR